MLFALSSKQYVVSLLSAAAAVYGLIYADGTAGTTWFHCNYYRLHYFDYQKYCNGFLLGMYVQDMLVISVFLGSV